MLYARDNLCIAGLCSLGERAASKGAGTRVGSAKIFITLLASTLGFLPCSDRILSSAFLIFFSKDVTAFVFFTKAEIGSLTGFNSSYSRVEVKSLLQDYHGHLLFFYRPKCKQTHKRHSGMHCQP